MGRVSYDGSAMRKDKADHVWVVRHAERCDEALDSPSSLPTGAPAAARGYDPAITLRGVGQAMATARFVESECRPTLVVSSPFLRCVQTSWPLAHSSPVPLVLEPLLSEWLSPKLFRGVRPGPLVSADPAELASALGSSFSQFCVGNRLRSSSSGITRRHCLPEYPESASALERRCLEVVEKYCSPPSGPVPCRTSSSVVIVTHGTCGAMICGILDKGDPFAHIGCKLGHCNVSHFVRFNPTDAWQTDFLFSSDHLAS